MVGAQAMARMEQRGGTGGHRMRKVVVVGAELAGLAAARRLVALGRDVTTVEGSRDRVGRRSEGILLEDGTPPPR